MAPTQLHRGTGWTNIKANFYSFETLALTAETSIAATFTNGTSGSATISIGGVWGANRTPIFFGS